MSETEVNLDIEISVNISSLIGFQTFQEAAEVDRNQQANSTVPVCKWKTCTISTTHSHSSQHQGLPQSPTLTGTLSVMNFRE